MMKFFHRQQDISGQSLAGLEKNKRSGFIIGTIDIPRAMPAEQKIWADIQPGSPGIKIHLHETALMQLPDLREHMMHELITQQVWQLDLMRPNRIQIFVRDCNLPSGSSENKTCLAVGAGFFPDTWKPETLMTFDNHGHLQKKENVQNKSQGMAMTDVFREWPVWGVKQDRALVSSLHLEVLEKCEEYDRLRFCETGLHPMLKERLRELENYMYRHAIIQKPGKDADFDRFRDAMIQECGLVKHTGTMTAADIEEKNRLSRKVLASLMAEPEWRR